ncbi:LacI family DNA-binding transcriptional regulator [Aureibacillus halotolerans]|uniref:LacI family transcriptional regulator n=1 Tax=Aureibacillus halotolerans TaxID=1508390 RepID=A0A4R6TS52_9BACI|nr:LacI family DNA-binding transcriptional regulator [Aureibacillus halotolerans]TDQ36438.1 LacI family transcriptional regulator [Aureibacillus halotolerans]
MATIYDIAKIAQVSPMTVSRVINNKGNVSISTQQKVEAAIAKLHYVPNDIARSLQSKHMKMLALLVTDIMNPFFTQIARGAEDMAHASGYQLMLCNTDEDIKKEAAYIKALISKRVDGAVIVPTGDYSTESLHSLQQANIPFTLLDRRIDGIDCESVVGDSEKGLQLLIDHLVQQGHERIGFINAPMHISTARLRFNSYEASLASHGIALNPQYISESHFQPGKSARQPSFLSLPENTRPTAIIAANNFIADILMQDLHKHGLSVPEDMAVACFDEFQLPTYVQPFFTTVAQPAYAMGQQAAKYTLEQVEDKAASSRRQDVMDVTLHIRASTVV